jgi:GNAT superfamily N-acetyltransferase
MYLCTELAKSDRADLLAMVRRCSPTSRRARFLTCTPSAAADHVESLFQDTESRTIVVRALGTGIIGLGSLFLYGNGRAEIALLVEDPCQSQGIGRLLLDALREHARAEGVRTLEMTALTSNTRMIRLFRTARFSQAEAGTVTGQLALAA